MRFADMKQKPIIPPLLFITPTRVHVLGQETAAPRKKKGGTQPARSRTKAKHKRTESAPSPTFSAHDQPTLSPDKVLVWTP